MRKIPVSLLLFAIITVLPGLAQNFVIPEILPQELETELALSALPPHLRSEAGTLLLNKNGYQEGRKATNGFTCLVRRMGAVPGTFNNSILPVCYDKEGEGTVLKAVKDEVKLLVDGYSPAEVVSIIDDGWKSGKYQVPGPGVSYMLSPIFYINGQDGGFVPHVMFYSPHKPDKEVGASSNRLDYVPFIQAPGKPSAVMVLPVGVQERAEIMEAEKGLIAKVQAYLNK